MDPWTTNDHTTDCIGHRAAALASPSGWPPAELISKLLETLKRCHEGGPSSNIHAERARQAMLRDAFWELPMCASDRIGFLAAACARATAHDCQAFAIQLAETLSYKPTLQDEFAAFSAEALGRMVHVAGWRHGKSMADLFLSLHSPGRFQVQTLRDREEFGAEEMTLLGREWGTFLRHASPECDDPFEEEAMPNVGGSMSPSEASDDEHADAGPSDGLRPAEAALHAHLRHLGHPPTACALVLLSRFCSHEHPLHSSRVAELAKAATTALCATAQARLVELVAAREGGWLGDAAPGGSRSRSSRLADALTAATRGRCLVPASRVDAPGSLCGAVDAALTQSAAAITSAMAVSAMCSTVANPPLVTLSLKTGPNGIVYASVQVQKAEASGTAAGTPADEWPCVDTIDDVQVEMGDAVDSAQNEEKVETQANLAEHKMEVEQTTPINPVGGASSVHGLARRALATLSQGLARSLGTHELNPATDCYTTYRSTSHNPEEYQLPTAKRLKPSSPRNMD